MIKHVKINWYLLEILDKYIFKIIFCTYIKLRNEIALIEQLYIIVIYNENIIIN